MQVTSANSSAAASDSNPRVPTQTLGQADFLKLLVTQLSSQDPLNPKKDTDFIAQMAQFSALEQTKTMQADIAQLRSGQETLNAGGLIGRAVQVQNGDEPPSTGIVSGVQLDSGTPMILVNGQPFALSQVLAIAPAEAKP